ncbi:D-tyrosyl-tRNA(Tyr) deacylase [Chytridiales sp. JEL 0842]|nr:D-tyrosyl-tRNA(Tyr) deacylase [Chytridiales sp. JEL 0842]
MQVSLTLALLAVGLWFLFDRTWHGFIISAICAAIGTWVVFLLVANGAYNARKILNLRLWPDAHGKPWKSSVKDLNLQVLSVSQFTLYALTGKGSKPDFHSSMKSEESKGFYERFLERLREGYEEGKIEDGEFGAMMEVEIVNDGPVTILIDSRDKK